MCKKKEKEKKKRKKLTIGFSSCVADTKPITAQAIVRLRSFRSIITRTLSAWQTSRTTPDRAARLENSPKSRCSISTTSTRSCSREFPAWSSKSADAHSPRDMKDKSARDARGQQVYGEGINGEEFFSPRYAIPIISDNRRRCLVVMFQGNERFFSHPID